MIKLVLTFDLTLTLTCSDRQREEQREARMRLKDKEKAGEETWAKRFTQDPRQAPTAVTAETHAAPAPASSSYPDYGAGRVNSAPQPAVSKSMEDAR
jgi:hypothetical protein